MSTVVTTARRTEASPLFTARMTGVFWLLTVLTGTLTFWLLVKGVNVERWKGAREEAA